MPDKPHFEVASGKELREKYGLTAENRPTIHLDPSRVPAQFRQWIPLAERWGIGDDLIRDDCVQKATPEELRELLGENLAMFETQRSVGARNHGGLFRSPRS